MPDFKRCCVYCIGERGCCLSPRQNRNSYADFKGIYNITAWNISATWSSSSHLVVYPIKLSKLQQLKNMTVLTRRWRKKHSQDKLKRVKDSDDRKKGWLLTSKWRRVAQWTGARRHNLKAIVKNLAVKETRAIDNRKEVVFDSIEKEAVSHVSWFE